MIIFCYFYSASQSISSSLSTSPSKTETTKEKTKQTKETKEEQTDANSIKEAQNNASLNEKTEQKSDAPISSTALTPASEKKKPLAEDQAREKEAEERENKIEERQEEVTILLNKPVDAPCSEKMQSSSPSSTNQSSGVIVSSGGGGGGIGELLRICKNKLGLKQEVIYSSGLKGDQIESELFGKSAVSITDTPSVSSTTTTTTIPPTNSINNVTSNEKNSAACKIKPKQRLLKTEMPIASTNVPILPKPSPTAVTTPSSTQVTTPAPINTKKPASNTKTNGQTVSAIVANANSTLNPNNTTNSITGQTPNSIPTTNYNSNNKEIIILPSSLILIENNSNTSTSTSNITTNTTSSATNCNIAASVPIPIQIPTTNPNNIANKASRNTQKKLQAQMQLQLHQQKVNLEARNRRFEEIKSTYEQLINEIKVNTGKLFY